jgi:hypothetical protein
LNARGVRLQGSVDVRNVPWLAASGLAFVFANSLFLILREFTYAEWYVPVTIDYFSVPVIWLADVFLMAFVFSAIAALGIVQRHRARWLVVALSLTVLPAAELQFQRSAWAVPPVLSTPRMTENGVLLQTSGSSCAAVACANIARQYGVPRTEAEMVALLGTTVSGTTPAQVIRGMETLGFSCAKHIARDHSIAKVEPPAVLFVAQGNDPTGHAVSYMRRDGNRFEIWDPGGGSRQFDQAEIARNWSGCAIEIRTGSSRNGLQRD